VQRSHHIEPEEIAVKRIVIGPIHLLDLKPLGKEETSQFIKTIGHLVSRIPPEPAGIEDIRSGQDQSSSLMEEIINLLDKLDSFLKVQMLDDLEEKDNIEGFSNFLQAIKIMKLFPIDIHALINQFWEMAVQPSLKISV
jgi:hypothetical protein